VNDVALMPALFTHLSKRGRWKDMGMHPKGRQAMALVMNESERMVHESTLDDYDPKGDPSSRGQAPPGFEKMRDWRRDDYNIDDWNM